MHNLLAIKTHVECFLGVGTEKIITTAKVNPFLGGRDTKNT